MPGLIDPDKYVIVRATHEAGGVTLHEAGDCPKDPTCPVWADVVDHPILGKLVR